MFSLRFLTSSLILITGYVQSNTGFYGVNAEDYVPVNGEKYLGCYKDEPNRDLEVRFANGLSIRECFDQVAGAGLKYGGLQYGHECFGGNTVGRYGERPGQCQTPCSADRSRMCGGNWRQSVFIMEGYVPTGVCLGPTARWSGDPHFTTFDGLKYDCQGAGEFIILKALTSEFEVRGRFQYLEGASSGVTVTRSVAFNTGMFGDVVVTLTLPDELVTGTCDVTMHVDGVLMAEVDSIPGVAEIYTNRDKTYIYTSTGASMNIDARNAGRFGCYFSVSVCIPDDVADEKIVGLLGTPNGNMTDDWMSSGEERIVTPVGDRNMLLFQTAYDYCVGNWCVTDATDSMFTYVDTSGRQSFDGYNNCPVLFDNTIENLYMGADASVRQNCNDDPDCIIETLAGGGEEARALHDAEHALDEMETDPIDVITQLSTDPVTVYLPTPTSEPNNDNFRVNEVEPPTPTTPPGVKGDPHFKTWTGESYDFHGICDLVLLKNSAFGNGLGMDIHLRTAKYLSSWSYVSAAALRIGADIFEVTGASNEFNFWINGVPRRSEQVNSKNEENMLIATLSGYSVYYKQRTNGGEFTINIGEEDMIIIGTWRSFVRVQLSNAKENHFRDSVGLMGSFSEGTKLARDNITVLKDMNVFGQEWQVLNSERKLFHAEEGPQHPYKCEIPSSLEMRRRLEESTVAILDAKKACASVNKDDFDLCVFDVTVTNDELTAGAY